MHFEFTDSYFDKRNSRTRKLKYVREESIIWDFSVFEIDFRKVLPAEEQLFGILRLQTIAFFGQNVTGRWELWWVVSVKFGVLLYKLYCTYFANLSTVNKACR